MGLDCSHGAWHGGYSSFMRWRQAVAHAAGMPPLEMMEGFHVPLGSGIEHGVPTLYVSSPTEQDKWRMSRLDEFLPIRWEALVPDPLHVLLSHSDCDGEIAHELCGPIADRLEAILPNMPEGDGGGHIRDWRETTQQFIDGLRLAAERKEPLDFH